MEDVATPAGFIDVSTAEGVVTLEGSVSHILARERAEKIARTVKGVRAVVNRITVAPPYRTDAEIREKVENALLANPATDSWQVAAEVDTAVVTLTGRVDSWQEKQLAWTVAKGVYGVRDLRNELDIDYDQARTDAQIRDEVAEILLWDSRVDSALIDVSVEDGRVGLSGIVGSAAERRIAVADAWVDGTEYVDLGGKTTVNSDLE